MAILVFVTGPPGPQKVRALGQIPRPTPLNCLGQECFFRVPSPCPRPRLFPSWVPVKIGGEGRGPIQGMMEDSPRTGWGRDHPQNIPPGPLKWQALVCEKPPRPAL